MRKSKHESASSNFTTPQGVTIPLTYDGRGLSKASSRALRAEAYKRCIECKEIKPITEFSKDASRYDGFQRQCRPCNGARRVDHQRRRPDLRDARDARHRVKHQNTIRAQKRVYYVENADKICTQMRVYAASARGVAAALRGRHGFSVPDSMALTLLLRNDDTRCWCCGVPAHILKRMKFTFPAPFKHGHKSMHTDHVRHDLPRNDLRTVLPACAYCNLLRGREAYSPQEALMVVGSWWRAMRKPFALYWLNTGIDPVTGLGVGGRLHRNETMRRKFEALRPELREEA